MVLGAGRSAIEKQGTIRRRGVEMQNKNRTCGSVWWCYRGGCWLVKGESATPK